MPLKIPDKLRLPESLYARPDMSAEERRRRGYLALCILIFAPTISCFGVVDLVQGRLAEAATTFLLAAGLATVLALLPRWQKIWGLFRITILLAIALVSYLTAIGAGEGFAFLWSYALPVLAFFLFGKKEGAAWVTASFVILLVLFFGDLGSHPYAAATGVRVLTSWGIFSVLAYALEASRHRDYEELLAEKVSLENALAQVKTLSGLLPICASCKSVRDDRGYWSQIENYVRRHSEAEFSRDLCPECRARPGTEAAADSRQESHAASGG